MKVFGAAATFKLVILHATVHPVGVGSLDSNRMKVKVLKSRRRKVNTDTPTRIVQRRYRNPELVFPIPIRNRKEPSFKPGDNIAISHELD
jgi:hypothetical protein